MSASQFEIPAHSLNGESHAFEHEPALPLPGIEQTLQILNAKVSRSNEIAADVVTELAQLQRWQQELDWLRCVKQHSQLLFAVIDLKTFRLQAINDHLRQIMEHRELPLSDGSDTASSPEPHTLLGWDLFGLLSATDQDAVRRLYRRHVLYAILQQHYQTELPEFRRLLDESVLVTLPQSHRQLELWLRSDRLQVKLSEPLQQDLAALGLDSGLEPRQLSERVLDPARVAAMEERLNLDRYEIEGLLLLEGLDVTERQIMHALIQLLIDRESVLQPPKFNQVNGLMRSLFQADNSLILSAESQQARLFTELDQTDWTVKTYLMESLQGSHFFRAAEANGIVNLLDLQADCPTECERDLRETGVRSLLLIPLVMQSMAQDAAAPRELIGVVGLTSNRPHAFDSVDCRHASLLIPALTAALRHAIQRRFTHIHSSVEWRFIQEAERRSWGLPPEPIVFTDVYPLYGISDIRGSSEERNRAIQADLLQQFQLAIAVVQAVCDATDMALSRQLQLDLEEQFAKLQQGVSVDAEVTLTGYLAEHVEQHFAYFAQCSPEAQAAVEAYRAACSGEQGCVYSARADYDQKIQQINGALRDTWAHWQEKMQQILRHYCDIESTDGIDHMIYAGASIDPRFCDFHLHSLRYDQLRAVCDCARSAFRLKERFQINLEVTHLVLVQAATVDIFHDETTERLFDVRGTRDTRYEIVKKRIDKALDADTRTRITQPGMLTLVYSTQEEWEEYKRYFRYLMREGWISETIEFGGVEPLQGVTGLKFARVRVLPSA